MTKSLYIPLYEEEKSASPSVVCVTGATGFVAGAIVERLLVAGHTVRATVRDPNNEASVAPLKALPGASERLQLFKADLLQPGAFTEAVKGGRFVIHTASPFLTPNEGDDVKKVLLEPAVLGTSNLLDAVNATDSVERVVLTTSCAAIWTSNKKDATSFDESDWADSVSETNNPYAYSKKLAEEKAWEMAKAQNRWELVCMNPSYVMGPPIGKRLDGESIKIMSDIFHGKTAPERKFNIVDVRDVAAAHTLAMVHPKAHGRNIVCEGTYSVPQLCKWFHEKYPSVQVPEGEVVEGKPLFDNSKIQKELGFKFHSTRQCMLDMAARLIEIGKLSVN